MGYFFTTQKDGEELDILSTDFLLATDEEMNVARLAFHSECDEALSRLKESLPEDLANIVYKRHLVYYIRQVQEWMNTVDYNAFDPDYKPSESEEAVRRIFSRTDIYGCIEKYQRGDEASLSKNEYFIYSLPDEEVLENRGKYINLKTRPTEEGLLMTGSAAYNLIDYERVIPVTITDRKGFLYYCEAEDGHPYIVPSHRIFVTMEEAEAKIMERNSRRDATIEEYHLLEQSDDEWLNQRRQKALEWLSFNQDPPDPLIEELRAAMRKRTTLKQPEDKQNKRAQS